MITKTTTAKAAARIMRRRTKSHVREVRAEPGRSSCASGLFPKSGRDVLTDPVMAVHLVFM